MIDIEFITSWGVIKMIQRGKLVIIVIISIIATIVAGVNIKQAIERQMEESSLIDVDTVNKIEIQDIEIERHSEKEEKNIDEAVTTIDEVEADEQGQLAANAGGSGEAEVYETGEEDVVVGKDPSLVDDEENSENPKAEVVMPEGFSSGWDDVKTGEPDLPSEEDMQWAVDMIDQNGTVLH